MNFYLFGYPIAQSLSPLIHNTGFKELNLEHLYNLSENKDLKQVIKILEKEQTRGGSITIPHKETIISYLDVLKPEVKVIGAVNTIVKKKNKLVGYNTDWIGISKPILASNKKFDSALVIGAGGAARAACYALNQLGISFVIYNRTISKAQILAQEFNSKICTDINEHQAELIINTVPPTAQLTLTENFWKSPTAVFDIVYKPYCTPLLTEAMSRKIHTIHGIEMLLEQAYAQFQIWTMQTAPKKIIAKTVLKQLGIKK